MVFKYSLTIILSDDAIQVHRTFGISKKTYQFDDIKFAACTRDERHKVAAANISFNDGNSVQVSGFASQFDSLVDFISQHVHGVAERH